MKTNTFNTILLIVIIVAGGTYLHNNDYQLNEKIDSLRPKTSALSAEEKIRLVDYEDLVEMTLTKASGNDGSEEDLSIEDQKNLLKRLRYEGRPLIFIEGLALQIYARGPVGEENLPGIYARVGEEERYVFPGCLVDYNGYSSFGEWKNNGQP